MVDKQGYEKNGYDSRERNIKTTRYLNINSNAYTTSYTLDDGDNTTAIAYPNNGPTVNYSYWNGGSIKLVSLNNGNYNYYTTLATAFDEFEHITNLAYGNGLTVGRSYYSTSKRLQNISAGLGGSVFSRTLTYSNSDDIASISGTGITGTESVAYYNLHRIKSYTGLSSNYGYDPVGNITNNGEGGGSIYSYANPRKQAVRTAFGYTNLYDLCGNMMVRHGGLTNSQALTYDPENQLLAVAQAGVFSDEFGYAANGARLWKRIDQNPTNVQVWIGNIYEEKGGKVLYHVFAGSQQVCTFETNSPLSGGTDTNRVGYFYHEDNLNSSSALSDSSKNQVEVNVYYPFGRTQTVSPQASFQVSRRFTGQVFDSESGLYYYGARYYDPELGRFVQPDTIIPDLGNPQSYNRYSYVLNNPLRYTDPTGHDPAFSSIGMFQTLSIKGEVAASRAGAPIGVGVGVAMISGGLAAPALVSAGASTVFVGIGSGMVASASGDLATQGAQLGLGQRDSINLQEVEVNTLVGAVVGGTVGKVASTLDAAAADSAAADSTVADVTAPSTPNTSANQAAEGGGKPFVPDEYWQGYAPEQVTPGTRRLDFTRESGRTGRVEESRVIYDEFGRQTYRVDKTDHMRPESHSDPHLHEYKYHPTPQSPHVTETRHNF